MTIFDKSFANMDPTTIPVDTEYVRCNFSRSNPDKSGADPVGVRLFPGDDTPRTFIECNLKNCEPPPGSTLTGCNTVIAEQDVFDRNETITVDSVVVSTRRFNKSVVYGRLNPETLLYEYKPTPEEYPE